MSEERENPDASLAWKELGSEISRLFIHGRESQLVETTFKPISVSTVIQSLHTFQCEVHINIEHHIVKDGCSISKVIYVWVEIWRSENL